MEAENGVGDEEAGEGQREGDDKEERDLDRGIEHLEGDALPGVGFGAWVPDGVAAHDGAVGRATDDDQRPGGSSGAAAENVVGALEEVVVSCEAAHEKRLENASATAMKKFESRARNQVKGRSGLPMKGRRIQLICAPTTPKRITQKRNTSVTLRLMARSDSRSSGPMPGPFSASGSTVSAC